MDYTRFRQELYENLTENILPYWIDKMVDPNGGFYGRRDGNDRLDVDAPKGAILNARILWSFSAAYRLTKNPDYLVYAKRAHDYLVDNFFDKDFGGTYWSLNPAGTPADTKKQFYAIAFAIYGLAEYYLASGCEASLAEALDLFDSIELHSRDRERNGYVEAATREWNPIADMRLSEHDANASKTMNTHLHIVEGYMNLLRALKEKYGVADASTPESVPAPVGRIGESRELSPTEVVARVGEATSNLLDIFFDKIENQSTHHLTLFFDDDWNPQVGAESYGHDIEASWLLLETAFVVGNRELIEKTLTHTRRIAFAGLQGRCTDGSMVYERHPAGNYDNDKHWWVQAENVVGQLWLAQYHDGCDEQVERAWQSWRYIAENLVDTVNGEWHWSRKSVDGSVNLTDDKAGFWKCPYHNSRMCIEAIHTLDALSYEIEPEMN